MSAKRILIVDDDAVATYLLEVILEDKGYLVSTAGTGQAGISQAQAEKPDLIILDIMLPDIDGYEVCVALKSGVQTSTIPVIMLSARDMGEDIERALALRADWYITKPYDMKYLISKVVQFIGAGQGTQ